MSREHARPACRNADTTRLRSRVHHFALAYPGLDAFDQDHAAPRRAQPERLQRTVFLRVVPAPGLLDVQELELRHTMRLGFQSPSSVGTWPPRTRNLPPYFSTVPGTCFRYSSNPAGSVTSFVDDEIRRHVRTSSSRRRELSHSSDVPHRRLAEVPLVLAVEVRGIVVTDSVAGFRRVEIFAKHQAPGLLKPLLLSGTAS